jgi:copper transport protein
MTSAHRIWRACIWRVCLVCLLAIGAAIGVAGPAQAHAQLESTSPQQGAKLTASPTEVSITFSETVTPANAGIRVIDAAKQRFDTGSTTGSGRMMAVQVNTLPAGAYVVVWQAVSGDGHPVNGSFTFQVGEGDQRLLSGLGEEALASSSVNRLVQFLLRLARFGLFAAAGSLIGAASWRLAGLSLNSDGWIPKAAIIAVTCGIAGLFLDGPYVEGRSIGSAFDFGLATDSISRVTVRALLGGAIVATFLASALRRSQTDSTGLPVELPVAQRVEIAVAALLVSLLLAASGHGAAGETVVLAVAVIAVHIAAAATWVGGIAMLGMSLRRSVRSTVPGLVTREVLLRWSKLAQVAVGALVCSGLANSWRQVGSAAALTSTHYGRLLMAKLSLVVAMMAFGAWHRRHIIQQRNGSIRRSVFFEVALGIAVLSLSTMISSTVPAKAALKRPLSIRVATTSTNSEITVSPAQIGKNVIHLYTFDTQGRTAPIVDAAFVFTHLDTGTKLEVSTIPAGRGHQQARGVDFTFAGLWQMETKIYLTEFDVENVQSTLVIR